MKSASWLHIPVLALTLCAGCSYDRAVMQDVRVSRSLAVQRWEQQARGEGGSPEALAGPLSLAQVVRIALQSNKRLKAALQERERAKGRVLEGASIVAPELKLQTDYTRLRSVPSFSGAGGTLKVGDRDNYSYSLTLRQPLFSGAMGPTIRGSRIYSQFVEQSIAATRQQVIYGTRHAYYDVLLAKDLLQVAEVSVDAARAHLAEAEKRKRQGVASDFDVLRASVELSNEEAKRIRLRNQGRLALAALLREMGVSQQSQVQLADPLRYEKTDADLHAAVRDALRNRHELLQSEFGVRLQEQLLKVAKSGWLPNLSLLVTYRRARPSPLDGTQNEWDDQLGAGISLEVPIFDGLRTLGKVRQSKAEFERRKIELSDTEEAILLEVRQAVLSLEDAAELVESQEANLERAKEGLRLAEARYRNDMSTQVEVLDARAALVAAQGLYHQAVYDHVLARLKLEKATGTLAAPEE